MSEIASSEVLLSTLPTKEVTLAPKQVTVVREIHTTIQPGQNELTIFGLDARVNRDSIRIEGSGQATITDIQTSIVPQRESFSDAYPDSEENESLGDEDKEKEDVSEDEECRNNPELQSLQKEINKVEERIALAWSDIKASAAVIGILDNYAKGLQNDDSKDVKKFEEFLNIYTSKRDAEAVRSHKANAVVGEGDKELARLQRRFERCKTKCLQERRKPSKTIRLSHEKRIRACKQRQQQRERKRSELHHFWGVNVGQVVVTLDSQNMITPGSSRRSSITGSGRIEEPVDVTLRLSYMVPGTGWASRYELQISSPSSSARLTYRAEFKNSSTETWRDTKVTLSTSQASFSGIGTPIPSLSVWNLRLFGDTRQGVHSWDNILEAPRGNVFSSSGSSARPRTGGLFGAPPPPPPPPAAAAPSSARRKTASAMKPAGLFGSTGNTVQDSVNEEYVEYVRPTSLFGGSASALQTADQRIQEQTERDALNDESIGSEGRASRNPPAVADVTLNQQAATTSHRSPDHPQHRKPVNTSRTSAAVELEEDDDADTQSLASTLEHQDSVKQDYGMTTTYELPGRRTLAPSFVSRRHVLAELDLKSVTLTYVIVPKQHEAAFLRARIKNTSSLTLHPGTAGITVDGSFVGTASLETCGPNVFFNIPLGVDPGIEVKYAKPSVKPLSGVKFFNKEDGANFKRSCWIRNNKSVAVDLVVSDQFPVSDDERVRVRLLQPGGLENEGDEVPLVSKTKNKGAATLSKDGEVKWKLKLEPREETRLVLEYETKIPSGSNVMSV